MSLFSQTVCPNCGQKISKSDLMLVETTIKTRVECCPSCIKYIDVKRRLTLQGKPMHSKPEDLIKPDLEAEAEELTEGTKKLLFENKETDLKEIKINKPIYSPVKDIEYETEETPRKFEKEKKPRILVSEKTTKPDLKEIIKQAQKAEPKPVLKEIKFDSKPKIEQKPVLKVEETKKKTFVEPQKTQQTREPDVKETVKKEEKPEIEPSKLELDLFDIKVIKKLKETGESRVDILAKELNADKNAVYRSLHKLKQFGLCREKPVEPKIVEKPIEEPAKPVESQPSKKYTEAPDFFEKIQEPAEQLTKSNQMHPAYDKMVCAVCGAKITEGLRFCGNCGTKLDKQQLKWPEEKAIKIDEEETLEQPTAEAKEAEPMVEEEIAEEIEEEQLDIEEEPEEEEEIFEEEDEKKEEENKQESDFIKIEEKHEPERKLPIRDPSRSELKTSWQFQWMVASKEIEDILASTINKKQADRKHQLKKKDKKRAKLKIRND